VNIVVDTNIIFSAILNANGLIGDIIFNSPKDFIFYSPELMKTEIDRYLPKLIKISKLEENQLLDSKFRILSSIDLVSEEIIKESVWETAFQLTAEIDEDDTPFVALAIEINAILWTGDKKLIKGLKKKGFNSIFSTDDLKALRGY